MGLNHFPFFYLILKHVLTIHKIGIRLFEGIYAFLLLDILLLCGLFVLGLRVISLSSVYSQRKMLAVF